MSEQEKGSPRGSQIIDGYGDDNSSDRLQGWDYYLANGKDATANLVGGVK